MRCSRVGATSKCAATWATTRLRDESGKQTTMGLGHPHCHPSLKVDIFARLAGAALGHLIRFTTFRWGIRPNRYGGLPVPARLRLLAGGER